MREYRSLAAAPPLLYRTARLTVPLAIAASIMALATACSSASSPAHATSPAATSGGVLAFSACMRSHGVPNFPDPSTGSNGGVGVSVQPGSGIDPNSPAYRAAMQSCQSLLPASQAAGGSISPAVRAQYLRYAACIRSHGEPSYPDPTFSRSAINFGNLSGIDPNSALYQSALRACASFNPMSGHGSSK